MLSVVIAINGRKIAEATAVNKTDIGSPCRYRCEVRSDRSPVTGRGPFLGGFDVTDHDRNQSAWALVAAMAKVIAEMEDGKGPHDIVAALQTESPSPTKHEGRSDG